MILNKKQNCEEKMNVFMNLDKGQKLPFSLSLHLILCKKCRTEVRKMTLAEKNAAEFLSNKKSDFSNYSQIESIMSKVSPFWDVKKEKENCVSMNGWIISGLIMIALMFAFGLYSKTIKSPILDFAFYVVYAGLICTYIAVFVKFNLDFFIKKISRHNISH